jgi:hypothetical protein
MIANLLIALAGLIILSAALAPIIGAWLRSRQPAPTCGNCRYFARHFDGTFCDRRAIWRLRTDQACNIGEVS